MGTNLAAVVGAYLLGSIPVGLIVVWVAKKKDLRLEHSGRTGGTNAMRVAGFWAGIITAIGDGAKALLAVLLARAITGGNAWVEAAAGVLAVFGHNYSIFLIEQVSKKIRLRGGAGGGSMIGAATAMWPPIAAIVIPVGLFLLVGVGYASVSTMTAGLLVTIIFLVRAVNEQGPWAYVVFGILVEALLIWSLRPNIDRLKNGTERLIGWRARKKRRASQSQEAEDVSPS